MMGSTLETQPTAIIIGIERSNGIIDSRDARAGTAACQASLGVSLRDLSGVPVQQLHALGGIAHPPRVANRKQRPELGNLPRTERQGGGRRIVLARNPALGGRD